MSSRRHIDIGVEGNDGTGDSIRESFRKTNENFKDLYAVFGEGGQIDFTDLADTPDALIPNTLPFVIDENVGPEVNAKIKLLELGSDSELGTSDTDSITFDYSVEGKIILTTAFGRVEDDSSPVISAPLDATTGTAQNPTSIATTLDSVTTDAVGHFESVHTNSDITIDNLVINKDYADTNYHSKNLPVRIYDEPEDTESYEYTIESYNNTLVIPNHGFTTASDGTAVRFQSRFSDPDNLTSGQIYYVRYLSPSQVALHPTERDANTGLNAIDVTFTFTGTERHTLTDVDKDRELFGNWLSTEALPRKSVIRRQGDDMEGPLFLYDHPGFLEDAGTPTGEDDLQAATKLYVDRNAVSSPTNLFVSTEGDDFMRNVPRGREGTSLRYAYKTINAACEKAEELIRTSPAEPGPYFQTITLNEKNSNAKVTSGTGIPPLESDPANLNLSETSNLLLDNSEYLRREILGYLNAKRSEYIYDIDDLGDDIEFIISSLAYDIRKSENADSLIRLAGERFYSDVRRRASVLGNEELTRITVSSFPSRDTETGTITVVTEVPHEYQKQDSVVFSNIDANGDALENSLDSAIFAIDEIVDDRTFTINAGLIEGNIENYVNNSAIVVKTSIIIDITQELSRIISDILNKNLYNQRNITSIDKTASEIVTTAPHGLISGDQVLVQDVQGMTSINNQTGYIEAISDDTIKLYEDPELTVVFDISSYNDRTGGGIIGKVYQQRQNYLNGVKILPEFNTGDDAPSTTAVSSVIGNLDTISTIIERGIDAGSVSTQGRFYNIVLDLDGALEIDQRSDTLPGKIITGKKSKAQGRIVNLVQENTFQVELLTPRDFIEGEELEYGNFVKSRQITIIVESGIYLEDYPIKVPQNVSIKGDEFRRTIIRPRRRMSQSQWSNVYFYRDLEFDGIQLLEKLHSTISSVGDIAGSVSGPQIAVDDTSWMQVGQTVRFAGQNAFGGVDKNTEYYITGIINEADGESDTDGIITVSTSSAGLDISFSPLEGKMYINRSDCAPFINQTDDVQGYFGRHYLTDPYRERSMQPPGVTNRGSYETGSNILKRNKRFIRQEVSAAVSTASQEQQNLISDLTQDLVNAYIVDLVDGGFDQTLEVQGNLSTYIASGEESQVQSAINTVSSISESLFNAESISASGSVEPDVTLGESEIKAPDAITTFTNIMLYFFNENYNPPKRNDADQMDVFMMNDATILRNMTVQGHGGFMIILDPEEQILTKSPYIQVGSSFSKSSNEKRFRGGMYVDAYVGNIPARITDVITEVGESGSFELEIESDVNQGLFVRFPQTPCPFYLDGNRYQVNAITNPDPDNGKITIILDRSSNNGLGYQGGTGVDIFLQTAGNRSMLGNDFTQINDLGYGLVTNNAAISEMVSMFTYYCRAAYYAKNGSEIRSTSGSNGYGDYGLVAEGADPNEIPDQVLLSTPMNQPALSYGVDDFTNLQEDATITVYGCAYPPLPESIVQVDHGSVIGVKNYRVSTVTNLSDQNGDGVIGEAGDEVSTRFSDDQLNTVYELALKRENASNDFFATLQADVSADALISIRNTKAQVFKEVSSTQRLGERRSTAINYDESDNTTYLTIDYITPQSTTVPLETDEVISITEEDYDTIDLEVDLENLGRADPDDGAKTLGGTAGDTKIAIVSIQEQKQQRLLRDIDGSQPGESGYSGGMIISLFGKSHRITGYVEATSATYIEVSDVSASEINASSTTGLADLITNDRRRILHAGLIENSTAEITLGISLCRATGHDFTQIGTGSYNDSNYPNVIFGDPVNPAVDNFAASEDEDRPAQIWERRKGRVFVTSTDEKGFFRVGKFFSVNQQTGAITFSGEIGVSEFVSLQFSEGTSVSEFSVDATFSGNSNDAVPTESAIKGYVDSVLGYQIPLGPGDEGETIIPPNRIGPGFLPLNGEKGMEDNLNMASEGTRYKIVNLETPGNDQFDATNKFYVDEEDNFYAKFNNIRNLELNDVAKNDIVVATGAKRIFSQLSLSNFTPGDIIETDIVGGGFKSGKIIDIEEYDDSIKGDVEIVTYRPLMRVETAGNISVVEGETVTQANTGASGIVTRDFNSASIIYVQDFTASGNWDTENDYELTGSISNDLGSNSSVQDVYAEDFSEDDDFRNIDTFAVSSVIYGALDEFANAYEDKPNSIINLQVTRDESETYYSLQIEDGSIFDTDINSNAAIAQTKLNMQSADLFDESDNVSGWNNTSKTQADLGLAKFSDENFEIDNGYVRLKSNGVNFDELRNINQYTLLGRQSSGTGDPEQVSYSDTVKFGQGIEDKDFDNSEWSETQVLRIQTSGPISVSDGETLTQEDSEAQGEVQGDVDRDSVIYLVNYGNISDWDSSSNFELSGSESGALGSNSAVIGATVIANTGSALIRLDNGRYATTRITLGAVSDSLVRRDSNSKIDASAIQLDGDDIIDLSGTDTLRLRTPDGAVVFTSSGTSSANPDNFVTSFSGSIDVGNTGIISQSSFQEGATAYADTGWIASNWVYAKFLEANDERGSGSTGISLGAGTGFENDASDVIGMITSGSEQFVITTGATKSLNEFRTEANTILGNSSSDTLSINARINTNVNPDSPNQRDIGSSSSRWRTMYAETFDGTATEAKYADLAEYYAADREYESGTVVIFGGSNEITVTNKKGNSKIAGVVSENPAFLMNTDIETEHPCAVALQGRTKCRVIGKAEKGDMLVSAAIEGYAIVDNSPSIGTVIGKALEDKQDDLKGEIEIVVGRT